MTAAQSSPTRSPTTAAATGGGDRRRRPADRRTGVPYYVLQCCQDGAAGGLRDKPEAYVDYYHTCYSLSGMSLAQNNMYDATRHGARPFAHECARRGAATAAAARQPDRQRLQAVHAVGPQGAPPRAGTRPRSVAATHLL
jgi:hypothetical protein